MPNVLQNRRVLLANPPRGIASYVPPLDAVTSKVLAAWSMFRLFTGNAEALEVRRSSDSTAQDVNTLATGPFDADGYTGWVGGGSGYAKKIYDQKDANDVVQGTAGSQPAVGLTAMNSAAALVFGGASYLSTAGNLTFTNVWTDGFEIWTLLRIDSLAANYVDFAARGDYNPSFGVRDAGISKPAIYDAGYLRFDTPMLVNTNYLLRFYYHSGVWRCDVNGTTEATTHTRAAPSSAGARWTIGEQGYATTGAPFNGKIMAQILFKTALTTGEAAALTTQLKSLGGVA